MSNMYAGTHLTYFMPGGSQSYADYVNLSQERFMPIWFKDTPNTNPECIAHLEAMREKARVAQPCQSCGMLICPSCTDFYMGRCGECAEAEAVCEPVAYG